MSVEFMSAALAGERFVWEPSAMRALPLPALDVSVPYQPSDEDLHEVVQRHQAYLRRHGLLREGDADQQRLAATLAGLAMALFPRSEGEQLGIVVDVLSWSVAWRKCCANLQARDVHAAQALTWQVVQLTFGQTNNKLECDASPLVMAYIDVWEREAAGMSLDWRQRAQANWRSWLLNVVNPDRFAEMPQGPYLPGHPMVDWPVLSDLVEGSAKFELSPDVRETADITGLLDVYADLSQWLSDMCSTQACNGPVSRASGLFWLQLARHCTRQQAIRELVCVHGRLMNRWRALRAHLPGLYATLQLDARERQNAERYVALLESLMAGYYAWQRASCLTSATGFSPRSPLCGSVP